MNMDAFLREFNFSFRIAVAAVDHKECLWLLLLFQAHLYIFDCCKLTKSRKRIEFVRESYIISKITVDYTVFPSTSGKRIPLMLFARSLRFQEEYSRSNDEK